MKILTTIFLLLAANATWAQHTYEELSDKAFDFYLHKNKFDSALFYYRQIDQLFPDERPVYTNGQIATCYLKLGDTSKAEKYYLRCLSFDKSLDSVGLSQTRASFALFDIYYARQQFRQALTYLEYTKTKFKPLRPLCQGTHGGYEQKLTFAYKKSLCLYGLGEKDSAISALAPYIFRPVWDVYLDSVEYETMSRYFVNTVFELYGKTKAKAHLQDALNQLVYKTHYDEQSGMIFFAADCSIRFLNTTISLYPGGGCQVDKKGDIPEYYSKETLLKEFVDSPAYQYIMTDDLITILDR
ncbi:hypothetical protein HB364_21745 [Pseudoflavitalea sp. X16]|uniref:tetratricopeptide repeat protein n=1 Tax=Paraflavitalea devenefica TaxID=2716334 RepID=UPI0014223459|nr:hypothetical protein [Paraflavitalea devenefica]NII27721.1 hypothetical protein [Paraflavitalea devenefica]